MEEAQKDASAFNLMDQAANRAAELTRVHRALICMDAAKELLIGQREQGGPDGRALSVAITHLETAQLWGNEAMAGLGEGAL